MADEKSTIREQRQFLQLRSDYLDWQGIFQATPQPLMILSPRHEILAANHAVAELVGKEESEIPGRKCHELFHDLDHPPKNCPLQTMLLTGQIESSEIEEGNLYDIMNVSCFPVFDESGSLKYAIHSCGDCLPQKNFERKIAHLDSLLQALFTIRQMVAHEKGQHALLQGVCNILTDVRKYPMVWLGLIEEEHNRVIPAAQSGFAAGCLKDITLTWDNEPGGKCPVGTAILTDKPCAVRDITNLSHHETGSKEGSIGDYRSSIAIPIKTDEKIIGALNVYSSQPDAFDVEETNLLIQVSHDVATAMNSFAAENAKSATEAAIIENEIRFRYLAEAASDLVWTVDKDARFIYITPKTTELLGYSQDEITGKSFFHFIQEGPEHIDENLRPSFENHEPFSNIEIKIQHKNGSIIFLETSGVPMFDGSGECLGFRGIMRDITTQKLAELEIRHKSEQLTHLLQSLPVIPFTCKATTDMEITYVGGAVKEITGFSPEKFISDTSFWHDHIVADTAKKLCQDFRNLYKKRESQCEYLFEVADGSYKWFLDSRRVVKNPDGSINHIVGTWHDITEEKKMRQEADCRQQQVIQADKLASLGEVVAGVAHEINNPNSFISYNIPLIEETWRIFEPIITAYGAEHRDWNEKGLTIDDLCQDMDEIIKALKIGSERINTVVNKLKDFSRLDKGGRPKRIQINEVIDDAWTIVGAQARKSFAKIEKNLEAELPEIHGHHQKLEQVITNLIVNACSAVAEKEKARLSIVTRYIARLNALIIEVEDNGMGMEGEVVSHIFEPFFTTRRDSGGTGLGLSVSYGLIQEHNGIIGVQSKPGIGTKFILILPTDRRNAKLALKPTILCVEDDAYFLNLLESFFIDIEIPFEIMGDSESMLDYLEEHPEIDIVLTDINMPKIDGGDLLAKIKIRFPLISVIMCTGAEDTLQNRECECKPEGLVTKPLALEQLAEMINGMNRIRL